MSIHLSTQIETLRGLWYNVCHCYSLSLFLLQCLFHSNTHIHSLLPSLHSVHIDTYKRQNSTINRTILVLFERLTSLYCQACRLHWRVGSRVFTTCNQLKTVWFYDFWACIFMTVLYRIWIFSLKTGKGARHSYFTSCIASSRFLPLQRFTSLPLMTSITAPPNFNLNRKCFYLMEN